MYLRCFLFLTMYFLACKKNDTYNGIQPPQDVKGKFLAAPKDNPLLQRLSQHLRAAEAQAPFIENLTKEFGLPRWDKVILQSNLSRTTNAPDSFVLLPVVNNDRVTSFFTFRLNDSVRSRFFNPGNYV